MTGITLEYLDSTTREDILDLMEGDAEMIIDLIESLMESSPELLSDLREGLEKGDSSMVKNAAHTLKSSNAQLGALDFADLCLEMESIGKSQDLTKAAPIYESLQKEYEKVEQALNSWKTELEIK
ncbi:MAG: Hpt domain-containing protein [Bacteroidia bacterium]|nr:Hpt domain-containing protein [Bacteroidia bacterium]